MSVPDIAPTTSGPSTRLRFLMWYFLIGGVLAIVVGVVTGGMRIFNDDASSSSPLASLLSSALRMVTGGAWMVTGRLLGRQRRAGAIMAIVSFALPIAEWFAGNQVSHGALAFHVAGLALLASVWSELRAD